MNRVFGLCGKNVTFSNIFKSLGPTIATKPAILYKPIEASCRLFSQRLRTTRAPLNIDGAQITKDVIIYKYENPKYFKFMNVFALAQFAMFSTYSQFSALSLRSTPAPETNESQPWYMKFNMGDASFKYGLSIVCFVLGMESLLLPKMSASNHFSIISRICYSIYHLDIYIAIRSSVDIAERRF